MGHMYDDFFAALGQATVISPQKTLLVSVNPDLKSDFGHFLNYEKRINEICSQAGIVHHCLSHLEFTTDLPYVTRLFPEDSGHFSLLRSAAKGHEQAIAGNMHKLLVDWLQSHGLDKKYEKIVIFIYMSSTKSAAMLSCFDWPGNVMVVANAFWDFLAPPLQGGDKDAARLKLQNRVALFSMSVSHHAALRKAVGFDFPAIPNPPPLVSDQQFIDILRKSFAEKSTRYAHPPQILLPGLMSMGKGREVTEEYMKIAGQNLTSCKFVIRDRKGELAQSFGERLSSNIRLAEGDFTDAQIIAFFQQADIAILPYSSEVFRVRTSGALVDCLMSATIPVVFPGTWLSDMCERYGFGIICKGETAEDMQAATQVAVSQRAMHLRKLLPAAIAYLRDNSWARFREAICVTDVDETSSAVAPEFSVPVQIREVRLISLAADLLLEPDRTLKMIQTETEVRRQIEAALEPTSPDRKLGEHLEKCIALAQKVSKVS